MSHVTSIPICASEPQAGPRALAQPVRYGLTIGGIALGYFLAATLGLSLATVAEQVSPVWPPTGLAIAAVLLLGMRVWPGIALGAFVANALADEPILTACGIAAGNTLEAVVAAALLGKVVNFQCAMQRKRDVLGFAIAGGCIGPAISATIGVISLCLSGVTDWNRFEVLWLTWWFGNAMGAIIVAPPLLTFGHWFRTENRLGRASEYMVFITTATTAGFLVLVDPAVELHLKYLLFPLFVWSALRFEQFSTAMALMLVCTIAVAGVILHPEEFAGASLNSRLLLMQTFVGVLALAALTLGAAAAELRSAADTHRQSEERLSAIFNQVIAGVAQTDLSGRFTMVNQKYCDIVGRTSEDLMDLRMQDITHPADVPVNGPLFERCAREGRGFVIEKRYLRPDGSAVWVSNHVSAVRNPQGRPAHVVAVVQDIGDRKEMEERRRLLFAELNHRVKNTLATVLSIVARTSDSAADQLQFYRDLESRLKSLAETHSILMQEDWAGAELAAIAERELRPHSSKKDGRVRLGGPGVYLTPRTAMSLHLVLHELTTNAAKYGALSSPEGRVELTWAIESANGTPRLRLSWQEADGPEVKPPHKRGFGSTVIEDAVQYELDGETRLDYRPGGFRYDLLIPFTADVGRLLEMPKAALAIQLSGGKR